MIWLVIIILKLNHVRTMPSCDHTPPPRLSWIIRRPHPHIFMSSIVRLATSWLRTDGAAHTTSTSQWWPQVCHMYCLFLNFIDSFHKCSASSWRMCIIANITQICNAKNQFWLTCFYEYSELAWSSGSVTDCHAMTRGSIRSGNSVFTELHVLRKGQ